MLYISAALNLANNGKNPDTPVLNEQLESWSVQVILCWEKNSNVQ